MKFFLSDKSLQGMHLISKRHALEVQLICSNEKFLSEILDKAIENKVDQLLCMFNPVLFKMLAENPKRWPFKVFAIVPHFSQFVRDTSHYGTTGAAIRRVMKMSLMQKAQLGIVALSNIHKVLKMRFDMMMNLFLMAESAQFFLKSGVKIQSIILHPQITDLALSLNQTELFRLFCKIVKNQYGAEPGFSTLNFSLLVETLQTAAIPAEWIVAPFNSKGYGMNPDSVQCNEWLNKNTPYKVIAEHWQLGNEIPLSEGLAYLKSISVFGSTIEFENFFTEESYSWLKHNPTRSLSI